MSCISKFMLRFRSPELNMCYKVILDPREDFQFLFVAFCVIGRMAASKNVSEKRRHAVFFSTASGARQMPGKKMKSNLTGSRIQTDNRQTSWLFWKHDSRLSRTNPAIGQDGTSSLELASPALFPLGQAPPQVNLKFDFLRI